MNMGMDSLGPRLVLIILLLATSLHSLPLPDLDAPTLAALFHADLLFLLTHTHLYSFKASSSGPPSLLDKVLVIIVGESPTLHPGEGTISYSDSDSESVAFWTLDIDPVSSRLGNLRKIPLSTVLNRSEPFTALRSSDGRLYTGGLFAWDDVDNNMPYGIELRDGNQVFKAPEYGLRKSHILEEDIQVEDYGGLPPSEYALSFESRSYLYFVRSVVKETKPWMSLAVPRDGFSDQVQRRQRIQVAQVCLGDTGTNATDLSLQSWINVELDCAAPDVDSSLGVRASASLYWPEEDALVILATTNGNSGPSSSVSWIRMDTIRAAFNNTYFACQERGKPVQNAGDFHVVSRKALGGDYCYARGCRHQDFIPRCDSRSTSCNFQRLDNFQPVKPDMASHAFPTPKGPLRLLPGDSLHSVFIRGPESLQKVSFHAFDRNNVKSPEPYQVPIPAAYDRVLASDGAGALLFGKGDKVDWTPLTCATVVGECGERAAEFMKADPLGCVWCVNKTGLGSAVPRPDCPPHHYPLTKSCPPTIHLVRKHNANSSVLEFLGQNLELLNVKSITACGKECKIRASERRRLTCDVGEKLSSDCSGEIRGHYVADDQDRDFLFTFSLNPSRSAMTSSLTPSSSWIAGLVVAALVLVLAAILGVCFWRRCKRKKKRNTDSSSIAPLPMDVQPFPRRGNRYAGHETGEAGETSPPPYEDMSYLVPAKLRLPYSALNIASEVGSGHFGVVYKALYQPDDNETSICVAVKTLNSPSGVREFLKEGLRMENFEHERVMGLVGITFLPDNNYPMIVTPFMPRGDLLSYLQDGGNAPTLKKLLGFCVEIAEGMAYLHKIKFIHRDLAARNCMLDENLHVRISDFGLTRDVYEDGSYVPLTDRFMPLRWLAMEGIESWLFTYKGDVWAYGVTCWEITTRGQVPYHQLLTPAQVMEFLKSGRRLNRPEYCPESLYSIMMSCWAEKPESRPSFGELCLSVPSVISELEQRGKSIQIPLHHSYINYLPGEGQMV